MMPKPISYKAPAYALIFPRIAETVRPLGYAAAIHGSMANDLDIVLVPWTNEAIAPHQVAQAVYEMIEACFGERRLALHGPEKKPHGRMAWTVPLLAGCAVDLSIIPPAQDAERERDAMRCLWAVVDAAGGTVVVRHKTLLHLTTEARLMRQQNPDGSIVYRAQRASAQGDA